MQRRHLDFFSVTQAVGSDSKKLPKCLLGWLQSESVALNKFIRRIISSYDQIYSSIKVVDKRNFYNRKKIKSSSSLSSKAC